MPTISSGSCPQLTGGLGRLYRGGAVFTDAHQDHAITETAPGHSVTLSGRFPAHTGIVANIYGVNDPKSPIIGGGGPGASPFRFRGSTLIDWLRVKDERSRALSVSRKDRGAILPIGRAHQSAFWFVDGRFTTSQYYGDTLPDLGAAVQRAKDSADVRRQAVESAPRRQRVPGAGQRSKRESWIGVPVSASRFRRTPRKPPSSFTEYPVMDSLTAQFALAGLSAMNLGRGPQTDLLAVSFSTTDAVGHRFGPDSRELHDQIVRLDRYLGIFIDSLYRIRDSSRIVFALTADHGVAPYPELRAQREHVPAERVDVNPALLQAIGRLRAAHGDTTAIDFEEGMVTIDRAAYVRARSQARRRIGDARGGAQACDGRGAGRLRARSRARRYHARRGGSAMAAHASVGHAGRARAVDRAVRLLLDRRDGDARNAERLRLARAGDLLRPVVHRRQVHQALRSSRTWRQRSPRSPACHRSNRSTGAPTSKRFANRRRSSGAT